MENPPNTIPYERARRSPSEMLSRAQRFNEDLQERRTVRELSDEAIPREVLVETITAAATAPSGANRQPWRFALISSPVLKRKIRKAVEEEEGRNYEGGRMPNQWRKALTPLGTGSNTPFIETAPWLVVVFEEMYGIDQDGGHSKNYYVKQSVGIACGFLLAALHTAGLTAVPVTPTPLGMLGELLTRPENERPYLMYCVGLPAAGARVPAIARKSLEDVLIDADAISVQD